MIQIISWIAKVSKSGFCLSGRLESLVIFLMLKFMPSNLFKREIIARLAIWISDTRWQLHVFTTTLKEIGNSLSRIESCCPYRTRTCKLWSEQLLTPRLKIMIMIRLCYPGSCMMRAVMGTGHFLWINLHVVNTTALQKPYTCISLFMSRAKWKLDVMYIQLYCKRVFLW